MTTPQEILAGVPLFSMLPKDEVAKLARRAHEITVPAGTVVTGEDTVGESFGVIIDGQAAMSVHGQPMGVLGPGDYFGEMALIDESYRYRSATITAKTELHCLMFAKYGFPPLRHEPPPDGLGPPRDDGATRPGRREPLGKEIARGMRIQTGPVPAAARTLS